MRTCLTSCRGHQGGQEQRHHHDCGEQEQWHASSMSSSCCGGRGAGGHGQWVDVPLPLLPSLSDDDVESARLLAWEGLKSAGRNRDGETAAVVPAAGALCLVEVVVGLWVWVWGWWPRDGQSRRREPT